MRVELEKFRTVCRVRQSYIHRPGPWEGLRTRWGWARKTCSCYLVRYFWTLFWVDITKILDENLSIFTFLIGKLRKNLF